MAVIIGASSSTKLKRYRNKIIGTLVLPGGMRMYKKGFKGDEIYITEEQYNQYGGDFELLIRKGMIEEITLDEPQTQGYENKAYNLVSDPMCEPEEEDKDNIFVKQKNKDVFSNNNYYASEGVKDNSANAANGQDVTFVKNAADGGKIVEGVNTVNTRVDADAIKETVLNDNVRYAAGENTAIAKSYLNKSGKDLTILGGYRLEKDKEISLSREQYEKSNIELSVLVEQGLLEEIKTQTEKGVEDGFQGQNRKVSCVSAEKDWRKACKMVEKVNNIYELDVIIDNDHRDAVVKKAKQRRVDVAKQLG